MVFEYLVICLIFVCIVVNDVVLCYFVMMEKRSWVWEYFMLNEIKDKVICKLCFVGIISFIYKGMILNFINYFKGKYLLVLWFVKFIIFLNCYICLYWK